MGFTWRNRRLPPASDTVFKKKLLTIENPALVHVYLRFENAEGYVLIAVYLFIYLYACYSRNKKSFKPNCMKFSGMIGYYPGTI